MEHRSRKPNRIESYDYSQNGAYFITVCTKDRQRILSNIVGDDAHIVPTRYGEIVEKYIRNAKEVEKYVIMPDHIHRIIRLDNGSMWASTPTDEKKGAAKSNRVASIVRSIKTLSAKEIGEAVFQRSYYDHVIRNGRDYEEIWEYIECNPLRWLRVTVETAECRNRKTEAHPYDALPLFRKSDRHPPMAEEIHAVIFAGSG